MTSSDGTTLPNDKALWHQVDWAKAQSRVRCIQLKIMNAYEQDNPKQVKSLQRLLTRSFSAKVLAIRKATSSKGKSTPGVDGEVWNSPERKWRAVQMLNQGKYRAKPLRRVDIPKSNGKTRPLGIPTMYDRAMQALWGMALEPIAELTADKRSYGFRRYRSAHDAVENLWNAHCKGTGYVLDADIKGCFDNISHEWLLANIPMDKYVLKQWLSCGIVKDGVYQTTTKGVPQGGPISPMLANMALDGLEDTVAEAAHVTAHGFTRQSVWGHYSKSGVHVIRYADDFVITAKREAYLQAAIQGVKRFLAERGLELNEEKTRVSHIDSGYEFLGFHFRRYKDGKVIIKPSKSSIKTLKAKLSQTVKAMYGRSQTDVILALRPVVLGWCKYYQTICASKVFNLIDKHLFRRLWRWAKRRHPNKGARWLKQRYWRSNKTRNWIFSSGDAVLPACYTLPITRLRNLRIHANIFRDEAYFLKRRMDFSSLQISNRKAWLYRIQRAICPLCKAVIHDGDETNTHHVLPKLLAGKDDWSNLALVHANCHQSYHATHYARRA